MDWHMLEIGVLTTLATWVYLFSPGPGSRLAAAVVMVINILWILVERERPPAGRGGRDRASRVPAVLKEQTAATGDHEPPKNGAGGPGPDHRVI